MYCTDFLRVQSYVLYFSLKYFPHFYCILPVIIFHNWFNKDILSTICLTNSFQLLISEFQLCQQVIGIQLSIFIFFVNKRLRCGIKWCFPRQRVKHSESVTSSQPGSAIKTNVGMYLWNYFSCLFFYPQPHFMNWKRKACVCSHF